MRTTLLAMVCAAVLCMGAARAGEGGDVMQGSAQVPMEVAYQPAWLTWVSATTGALKALGVECDTVDVAGYSGYAFLMVVHQELCPSGPTSFDWGMLAAGPRLLGRSTVSFMGATCGGAPDDFRAAYDLAPREIEAGRPVVVWGAYVPEFAIAVGVKDGTYEVRSFKPFTGEPEPPIPFDKLDTPGGVYVLGFPGQVERAQAEADRQAVYHALRVIGAPAEGPQYAAGLGAYDRWIGALQAEKAAAFGNSYNAQCWAEAKRFAAEFLTRLAARNEAVAEPLGEAAQAYGEAAAEMAKVAELFPFPGGEGLVTDAGLRAEAVIALEAAKRAEWRGQTALARAAKEWPQEPAGAAAEAPQREAPTAAAEETAGPARTQRLGIHVLMGSKSAVPFVARLLEAAAALGYNWLILEVDNSFAYTSHPEVAEPDSMDAADARYLAGLAKEKGIHLVPMYQSLGHQSWHANAGGLLRAHPEFNEAPDLDASARGFYCMSWCPSNPDVNALVFDLMDELLDAFGADAMHVGMDEVFILGECERCKGTPNAQLFAKAMNDLHAHLVGERGVEMMMWGDRLLDAEATGYGDWEASGNGTAPAIDLIPKDIVICDWHYDPASHYEHAPEPYPSIRYFQEQGFRVWPAGWNRPEAVRELIEVSRENATDKMVGYLATTWGSVEDATILVAAEEIKARRGRRGRQGNAVGDCALLASEMMKE